MVFNRSSDQNNNNNERSSKTIVLENVNVLSDTYNSQFPALTRERLQVLKIRDSIIYDNILISILNQLTNVEILEFRNVVMEKKQNNSTTSHPRVICPHTKIIVIEGGDLEILNIIIAPNLQEFRFGLENIQPYEPLIFFMCQHSTINTLEIHATNSDIMNFFMNAPNYGFTLKHLSLISTNFDQEPSTQYEENFLKFLRCHVTSMRTLEIKANVTLSVLDFMLKHFRLLKTIELKVNKLPQSPQFYTIKKPRKSIKKLIITGPFLDLNTIISIIMLYPSIHHLSMCDYNFEFNINPINDIISDVLLHVTEICKDLQVLRVARMPFLKHNLRFRKLHTLQVAYIHDVYEITKIIADNPTINTLIIDFVFRHQSNANFLTAIVKSGIKRLSIYAEPVEIQSIHSFFSIYKGGVEFLELKCEINACMKTYEFKFSQETSNAVTSNSLLNDISYGLLQELVHYLEEL